MRELDVRNQELFYFSKPESDRMSYVDEHKGTVGLDRIVIHSPLDPRLRKLLTGDMKYLIVDGHNRAYADSQRGKRSRASLLETDADLIVVRNQLVRYGGHNLGHIIICEDIYTLLALEAALLNEVECVNAANSRLKPHEQIKSHYGRHVA